MVKTWKFLAKICGVGAVCLLTACASKDKDAETVAAADVAVAGNSAAAEVTDAPTASAEEQVQELTPGSPEAIKAERKKTKEAAKLAKEKAKAREAEERRQEKLTKAREKKRKGADKHLSKEEREELAIREAALRYVLSVERPGEIVFISFSPFDSVTQKWQDPPEGFMSRLDDLSLQLRPASTAIHTRSPVEDAERPNRMIQDPITNKAGSVYWAQLLKAPKEDAVRVDAGCFRGFLMSWGCILEMRKVRGVWQVQAQTSVWKT